MTARVSASPRRPSRRRVTAALLTLAQLGYAQWFFGNLYEAVVKIPDLMVAGDGTSAVDRRSASLSRPGSPVPYYIPGAAVTVAATLGALGAGWDRPGDRRWLVTAAAGTLSGVAITAYLVRAVNLKLFFSRQPPAPADQETLLCTWYRLNRLRLVAVGGAWLAARRAASRQRAS